MLRKSRNSGYSAVKYLKEFIHISVLPRYGNTHGRSGLFGFHRLISSTTMLSYDGAIEIQRLTVEAVTKKPENGPHKPHAARRATRGQVCCMNPKGSYS
jgi:hypothetical protein